MVIILFSLVCTPGEYPNMWLTKPQFCTNLKKFTNYSQIPLTMHPYYYIIGT